jgi:hypothetical protein
MTERALDALWLAGYIYVGHEIDEPGVYAVNARDEDSGEDVEVFITEDGKILSVVPA